MKYSIKHGSGRGKGKILKTCLDCDQKIIIVSRTTNMYSYDFLTGEAIGPFPDVPICGNVSCITCAPTMSGIFFIGNNEGSAAIVDAVSLKILSTNRQI